MAKMHKPSDKAKMEKPCGDVSKPAGKPAGGNMGVGKGQPGSMGKGIASKNKKYGY
jgi:hypothetical protein